MIRWKLDEPSKLWMYYNGALPRHVTVQSLFYITQQASLDKNEMKYCFMSKSTSITTQVAGMNQQFDLDFSNAIKKYRL